MGDPTPALRRQTAARTWAASPDPPRDYREAVRPRLPHVTGLGGVDRVTLRPELRVGQGLRLRRLAGSPTCWRAATGRGSRAPAAMGEWEGRRREITGFPRPPRGVREWKHEGGSEEAVCPALWLGCSAPTPFRARALPPLGAPRCSRARHPGWGPQSPGPALRSLPCRPPPGFSGPRAPSGCWEEPFRQRRLCVHLGAPRAGRCLPASPESWAGRGRALPESRESGAGTSEGPLLSRGLGFQDLWFR